VIEVIDPASLWVDARFDQISAEGLAPGLPAKVTLRSRRTRNLTGRVLRIEPRADAVTEETRAKIVFDTTPTPLPPLGELAEVTVDLNELPAAPVIPNAALRTVAGQRGVWKRVDGELTFTPVTPGRSSLDGQVQIVKGLAVGDQVVVYSERALTAKSRIHVVEHLAGATP
jgi:HlyD family secretion protein